LHFVLRYLSCLVYASFARVQAGAEMPSLVGVQRDDDASPEIKQVLVRSLEDVLWSWTRGWSL
jgi:hypothetical protein